MADNPIQACEWAGLKEARDDLGMKQETSVVATKMRVQQAEGRTRNTRRKTHTN